MGRRCAGSTGSGRSRPAPGQDHFRGREEGVTVTPCLPWGPSPRVRGAPLPHGACRRAGGTIPAGAGSAIRTVRPSARSRDHPRGRGEHAVMVAMAPRTSGPSPRMRGARRDGIGDHLSEGTIPAGVGSAGRSGRGGRSPRDHPRGRGEHGPHSGTVQPIQGPSPRARGALRHEQQVDPRPGTIPASAESAGRRNRARRAGRDHPRGCGEHQQQLEQVVTQRGPPPLVRGAHRPDERLRVGRGTIPAGAGRTTATSTV